MLGSSSGVVRFFELVIGPLTMARPVHTTDITKISEEAVVRAIETKETDSASPVILSSEPSWKQNSIRTPLSESNEDLVKSIPDLCHDILCLQYFKCSK